MNQDTSEDVHTFPIPIRNEHKHEFTRTCWCDPILEAQCDECKYGCFLCDCGWKSVSAIHQGPVHVIHNDL